MKNNPILATAAMALLGLALSAQDKVPAGDRHFMNEAAAGGAAEVELGQMAVSKGSSQKVKDFGQHMVDDHSKASSELKGLAEKKGVTLPSGPDAKNKAVAAKLSKLSGEAFDKAYMQDMVKDHEEDVAAFQKESGSGTDPDVKAWATSTLPTLQGHLKMAKDTYAEVNH